MNVRVVVVLVAGLLAAGGDAQGTAATVEELKEAAEKWVGDVPCVQRDCKCAFKSKGCCCANAELQGLREQAVDTFRNISDTISRLSGEVQEVVGPLNVAFTAFLGRNVDCLGPFDRNVSIPYDDIQLNDGSGYNSLLGLFSAPVSGVYSFSLSVYSRLQPARQPMFYKVQLMRNGRPEATMWEDGTKDLEDSSFHRLLLSLEQGDQVYAALAQDRQLCGNIRGLNSFSGYLVYPLPAAAF